MSLLADTVEKVINRLLREEGLEINPGCEAQVLAHCVSFLSESRPGAQLVDTLVKALLACPEVRELYASNQEIKDFITESRS